MNQSDFPISQPVPDVAQEPFPCPYCGQMLAASCRVCVACKQAVEPPHIPPPSPPTTAPAELVPVVVATPTERVRYPWSIFFLVLTAAMGLLMALQPLLTPQKVQWVMFSMQILSAVWVLFDAHAKRVPKALRWSLGTLLVWLIIFPWYLARRSKPSARCAFDEWPARLLARALLVLLLLGLLILVLKSRPGN